MKLILTLILLSLLSGCLHTKKTNDEAQENSEVGYVDPRKGPFQDTVGDGIAPYVDLGEVAVEFSGDLVTVKIGVLNMPESLTFDSVNVPANAKEYSWSIYFDVDADSTTANDINISIANWKFEVETEGEADVLSFTQKDAWKGNESRGFQVVDGVNVNWELSGSILIGTFNKSDDPLLDEISESTNVRFETVLNFSGEQYRDSYPND